jgi:hypothetical protein
MNLIHAVLLFSAAALTSGTALAKLYKSIDEQGNVVYSDTPTPGAEQLTPPPISTVPGRKVERPAESKPGEEGEEKPAKKPPTKYTKFVMVTPKNDDTIWDNNGAVTLSLTLEPPLDIENGHSVWVYVDGNAVVRKSQALVQPLTGIDRGAHTIRAEVRDANRKTLKRTKNVTVHMKRASALSPNRRDRITGGPAGPGLP